MKYWLVLMITVIFPIFSSMKIMGEEKIDIKIAYYNPDIAITFEAVYAQDHSKIIIILNDGSQWVIRNNIYEEFNKISANWRFGDEIRIEPRDPQEYQGRYILKNVRTHAVCLVDLVSICLDNSKANYIEKIDSNGYAIFTNGLEWAIGYWGSITTCKWRKGDRIVINKSHYSKSEDYLLINVDKGTDVWASLILWR